MPHIDYNVRVEVVEGGEVAQEVNAMSFSMAFSFISSHQSCLAIYAEISKSSFSSLVKFNGRTA